MKFLREDIAKCLYIFMNRPPLTEYFFVLILSSPQSFLKSICRDAQAIETALNKQQTIKLFNLG